MDKLHEFKFSGTFVKVSSIGAKRNLQINMNRLTSKVRTFTTLVASINVINANI